MVDVNKFKKKLLSGQQQIGIWSNIASTLSVEIIGGAGFDWVVLDAEHGPSELTDILAQMQAISRYDVEPMVRVPKNDRTIIKKYMDIGVRTFLIPFVETVEDARQAVAATRYPPLGTRGVSVANRANLFGRISGYMQSAHQEVCICAQIETRQALTALPEILQIEGIDSVFIGPSDLAASLGYLGDPGHADVASAIDGALAISKSADKPIGILAGAEQHARACFEGGFSYVAVGSDMGLLARGSETLRDRFRDVVP